MAKKKLIFDPNEDPEVGYQKWTQELMRVTNEPVAAGMVEHEKEARKNLRYFAQKMKEPKAPKPATEAKPVEVERTTDEYYKPYEPPKKKKPWPGWKDVLKKL